MPITSQTPSRAQLSGPSPKIIAPHTNTPAPATTQTAGTLKPRGSSGRRTRSITTPMQTRMKANSVPMLVMSPTMSSGMNPPNSAVKTKNVQFDLYGVRCFGCRSENSFGTRPSRLIE